MLSQKTHHSIDVVVAIACVPQGMLVTAQALSQKLELSLSYLESILRTLRQAGLVHSTRGAGGGYKLSQPADSITLWDVVSVLDDEAQGMLLTKPRKSPLTAGLDDDLQTVLRNHLSSRVISEFVKQDQSLAIKPAHQSVGFRLGRQPQRVVPRAPNSVFQLSSFMKSAMA